MTENAALSEREKTRSITAEKPATIADQTLLLLVTAGVIVLDHLTKLYIEIWLPLNTSFQPWPEFSDLFQFTHVSNTGAAFGLFPSSSNIFMLVALLVAVIILLYNYRLPTGHLLFRVALGLQLGGALGNFIDRIRLGHVTDFFDVSDLPVFNVADASIVVGVMVLIFLMLTEGRETEPETMDEQVKERPFPQPERQAAAIMVDEPATAEPEPQPDPADMLWNE